jgi:hydrogenase expression/formation protein HypC
MCVGLPLRIITVDGLTAQAAPLKGGRAETIDLALVGACAPGDHLLTHLGVAIRPLDADEARLIADALEAVTLAARGQTFEHLLADLIDREPELPAHLRPPQKTV